MNCRPIFAAAAMVFAAITVFGPLVFIYAFTHSNPARHQTEQGGILVALDWLGWVVSGLYVGGLTATMAAVLGISAAIVSRFRSERWKQLTWIGAIWCGGGTRARGLPSHPEGDDVSR